MLGLPTEVTACLFDLDGVLTQTAAVHRAAWKEAFDAFLRRRAERNHEAFEPFDPDRDYNEYVDGRPRADGVRTFLSSRGISVPSGVPEDPPDRDTVYGIGNRKNEIYLRRLHSDGVQVYEGSVAYARAARAAGLRVAIVSASANTRAVLDVTGLADLPEVVVDGVLAAAKRLNGKPDPDTFLTAAGMLQVSPGQAAVFEDAIAGVEAGRAGGFRYVVGVDRVGQADELRRRGADVVVSDLAELQDKEPR
ncbi:MAG: beta-phosphoglucomutase family hydrolase [Dactylosporangium sp.]|nr:beta-phosphoglucomutase family hydrolase [Dactylosporangium sp.]